ncbi:MAG: CHAD domain-containing protein [Candidatus Eremiobacteraeota bacterium]|nr:CHAD domain-containing protein [Candidatus Eremiobacteraeota bacterium]
MRARFSRQTVIVKGRAIPLEDVGSPKEAMRRIVTVRFCEVLTQAPALKDAKPQPLHDLRIACKRLRYTLELFGNALRECRAAERALEGLQQLLGDAHDCDILLESAQRAGAVHLAKRVRRDRERSVRRAQRLWLRSIDEHGAFASLIGLSGIGNAEG